MDAEGGVKGGVSGWGLVWWEGFGSGSLVRPVEVRAVSLSRWGGYEQPFSLIPSPPSGVAYARFYHLLDPLAVLRRIRHASAGEASGRGGALG